MSALARWAAWKAGPDRDLTLHLVCLSPSAAHWLAPAALPPPLGGLNESLLGQCEGLLPGVHRLLFEGGAVHLTLGLGPVPAFLREQNLEADTLHLDGPDAAQGLDAQNGAKALARCARRGATLHWISPPASWADALAQVGFTGIQTSDTPPQLQAVFDPPWQPRKRPDAARAAQVDRPGHCLVVGAGLAGAACAASLARRGWQVTVIDRVGPAAGASGLPAGLMAPHVSVDDSPLSRLSRAGVRATLLEAHRLLVQGQDWSPSGVLQRRLDDAAALPPDWPQAGRLWSQDASQVTGLPPDLRAQAIWHAQAAWIKPARLIQAWLDQPGIRVREGVEVHRLQRTPEGPWQALDAHGQPMAQGQAVVLATAHASQALLQRLEPAPMGLALQPIRGQVSWGLQSPQDRLPPVPVNGHGSLLPGVPLGTGQAWVLGASFERDVAEVLVKPQDHAEVLEKLHTLLPETAASLQPRFDAGQVQAWAGVRCATRDHLPVVGPLSAHWPGLWLCTAFGSRGLSYSQLCAELLAAWMHGEPLPLEPRLAALLRASRLLARA